MSTEISLADFKDMPYLLTNNGKATAIEFSDVYLWKIKDEYVIFILE